MAKSVKSKTVKKVVEKPYNSGTMTNAAFWGFIRSALRRKSMYWKPISECKAEAKRKYIGLNKRQRFEYLCNECQLYHPDKDVIVDHKIAAGSLNKAEDLPMFVTRLFCEIDNLCVLCKTCHLVKTSNDRRIIKLNKENVQGSN